VLAKAPVQNLDSTQLTDVPLANFSWLYACAIHHVAQAVGTYLPV